ncbi:MAG: AgmX/PglI C-terminal domain-containing protein [Pseudomonadota bacterium]
MKKLLILLIALILLILFLMYQQPILNRFFSLIGGSMGTRVQAIAQLSELNKSVTLKRSNDTVWNTAELNQGLAILDSLSTGYDSAATIRFNLGYIMNMGERSLIVIEDPKQEAANLIELNLDQGTLQAKNATSDTTTLKIKSNNTITEVKGKSTFTITVDKATKRAEIWITLGQARVKDKVTGKEIVIKENEKKIFSIENIEQPVEPVVPPAAVVPEVKPGETIAPPPEPAAAKPVKKASVRKPRVLKTNDIAKIVAKQRKKIDACYERSRRTGGKKLSIKFNIATSGIVTKINIARSDLNDPTVERCVMFWIKTIKFPRFDGAQVEQTVNFVFQ